MFCICSSEYLALCKEHGLSEVASSWVYLSPMGGWRGGAGA